MLLKLIEEIHIWRNQIDIIKLPSLSYFFFSYISFITHPAGATFKNTSQSHFYNPYPISRPPVSVWDLYQVQNSWLTCQTTHVLSVNPGVQAKVDWKQGKCLNITIATILLCLLFLYPLAISEGYPSPCWKVLDWLKITWDWKTFPLSWFIKPTWCP